MLWIVAYREDGEKIGRRTAWGRAAAIVAAVGMIDRGIEVVSVTDADESKSVSADEVRRVRDLRHTPPLVTSFGMAREREHSRG